MLCVVCIVKPVFLNGNYLCIVESCQKETFCLLGPTVKFVLTKKTNNLILFAKPQIYRFLCSLGTLCVRSESELHTCMNVWIASRTADHQCSPPALALSLLTALTSASGYRCIHRRQLVEMSDTYKSKTLTNWEGGNKKRNTSRWKDTYTAIDLF